MSRLTRDGTAEPVSRDQILRRESGQGNNIFPCLADNVQDWQPYAVDTHSCHICNHTSTHTTAMRRRVTRVLSAARTFSPLAGVCSDGVDAFIFFYLVSQDRPLTSDLCLRITSLPLIRINSPNKHCFI